MKTVMAEQKILIRGVNWLGDAVMSMAAVQRLHVHRVELVPGGRHELELGALAADERDVGAVSSQRVRDGDRRNDVSCGPAGADHERRRRHLLPAAVSPPVGRC